METLGTRIRAARTAKGISQADVADAIGVRSQTVYRYEKDRASPSVGAAVKLAAFLGTTVEYLVTGKRSAASWDRVANGILAAIEAECAKAEGSQ